MCYITATELKNNLTKYMELSQIEDIYVTKNNKVITVLTNPNKNAFERLMACQGILGDKPKNLDYKKEIGEEIIDHASTR